ncbi:MAG: DUF4293 domain-containing protein [Bacteroidota bacterium]
MIQRIQSVFLFLVVVIAGLMFLFPITEFSLNTTPATIVKLDLFGFHHLQGKVELSKEPVLQLLLINILIMVISVVAIFTYKNRRMQIRFTWLGIIFSGLLVVLIMLFPSSFITEPIAEKQLSIGIYLPFIMMILFFMAQRAIKKDDDLIRSADRLR